MHTEASGSSSNVTSILEATTTLDISFGSTASATAFQVTHSLTPIDIGSPTTSTFSPTTNPQRTPEPTLSSTSSPIPTPNTTLYNTQDATTDTDDPSTPDTSPTPDTTPDPTLSHSAVLTASPKVTTSPHTTTDTDVTVTPQSMLNPTPTLRTTPDSTGVSTGAVIAGAVASAVDADLVVLLLLVMYICFCRYVSYYKDSCRFSSYH